MHISSRSIKSFFNEEIKSPRVDILLLIIGFACAILDVLAYTIFQVSVAHNTLNILILSMGVVGMKQDFAHPSRAAVALLSSWFGSFLIGRAARFSSPKKRGWLFSVFMIQTSMVYLCVILLFTRSVSLYDNSNHIVISILSITFGAQFATIKLVHPLGCPSIPGQVVSGAMCDIFADRKLFHKHNVPRNHRMIFIFVFFLGGVVGSLLSIHQVDPAITITMVATLKLMSALVLLFVSAAQPILPVVAEKEKVMEEEKVKEKKEDNSEIKESKAFSSDSSESDKDSISSLAKCQVVVVTSMV